MLCVSTRILTLPTAKRLQKNRDEGVAAPLLWRRPDLRPFFAAQSPLRLAKTRSRDFRVGFRPGLLELRVQCGNFVLVLVLCAETFGKAEKRPAVLGQAGEIIAIDLLGFGEAAHLHEDSA